MLWLLCWLPLALPEFLHLSVLLLNLALPLQDSYAFYYVSAVLQKYMISHQFHPWNEAVDSLCTFAIRQADKGARLAVPGAPFTFPKLCMLDMYLTASSPNIFPQLYDPNQESYAFILPVISTISMMMRARSPLSSPAPSDPPSTTSSPSSSPPTANTSKARCSSVE